MNNRLCSLNACHLIHYFFLPCHLNSFFLFLVNSFLQLSFLFFPAWVTFTSTTVYSTGLVNWCWQLEFKLQPRHLTEQSSRSVSAAKCSCQLKQLHHLMRSRSWNTKHYSTVSRCGVLLKWIGSERTTPFVAGARQSKTEEVYSTVRDWNTSSPSCLQHGAGVRSGLWFSRHIWD